MESSQTTPNPDQVPDAERGPAEATGQTETASAEAPATAEQPQDARGRFDDWPQKDAGDDTQPWDFGELGIDRPGVDVKQLEPGAPNDVAPIVVTHGRPTLTSGSQGDAVRELADRLAVLGYPTSATRGENHFYVFDDSIRNAVGAFRRDYSVREDPSGFVTDQRGNAESHVGPWTWEALIRASDREREEAQA